MEITNRQIQYNVILAESENIKILINDNIVINETVPAGYKSDITYMYQQQKVV